MLAIQTTTKINKRWTNEQRERKNFFFWFFVLCAEKDTIDKICWLVCTFMSL